MDIPSLFKTSEFVYYLKLVNGDSIIGKSDDTQDKINEEGMVVLFDVMKTALRVIQHDNGNLSEIMTLAPWLDACDLSTPVSIPIESIVVIANAKDQIARKYVAYVLAQSIKEASADDADKRTAEAAVAAAVKAAQTPMHQPMEEAPAPRKPELLSRERMMEAEMEGDLEEIPEEEHEEEIPHYRKGNVTVH